MIPKVRLISDPVLRQKATALVSLDGIASLIEVMIKVMLEENGIGLAANQIGLSEAIFILKTEETCTAYLNPTIISMSDEVSFEEGCLSIPGVVATTKRYNKLTLEFSSLDDNNLSIRHTVSYEGIIAIAIQHEMDHLNGKLYVDQLGQLKKSIVLSKHRKYLKMKENSL